MLPDQDPVLVQVQALGVGVHQREHDVHDGVNLCAASSSRWRWVMKLGQHLV